MSDLTLRDLYALIIAEYGDDADPFDLAMNGYYWVMDPSAYERVRAACRAAGVIYPPDDSGEPKPEDRLYGLPIEIREDGGAPHVVRP